MLFSLEFWAVNHWVIMSWMLILLVLVEEREILTCEIFV